MPPNSWSDHARDRELSVEANSRIKQHKKTFGLDNAGKKFSGGLKFKRRARRIFQVQLCLAPQIV